MPISRDPRMDRRRRVLMDNGDSDLTEISESRPRNGRKRSPSHVDEDSQPRRGAGYSQDVRKACGQRLVQLIPVRKRSYAAVIFGSLLAPCLLLTVHYMIYVSGRLPWYGHPLAVSLDASHPTSIAAWFSSHLWLLCLGATVLTFQLRRHKLDDYDGEYRLWFWLVVTCLLASIDATTHVSDLFGLALDRWTQLNLGWSGPAVVQATLTVLIGMLGLRLCTELKSVPASLVFWLVGLVAWAGSAALGQEEFKVEISLQFRIWLKAALWLGGLTAVWLAALSYLRNVYVDAQRRFLLRGHLAAGPGVPLGKRIRESLPNLPSFRRGAAASEGETGGKSNKRTFSLPAFMQRNRVSGKDSEGESPRDRRRREKLEAAALRNEERRLQQEEKQKSADQQPDSPRIRRSPIGPKTAESDSADVATERRGLGSFFRKSQAERNSAEQSKAPAAERKPSRLSNWLRKPKDSDEPEEYRKVTAASRIEKEAHQPSATSSKGNSETELRTKSSRRWIPTVPKPKLKLPAIPKINVGGLLSRFKLPSLRLPPPDSDDSDDSDQSNDSLRSVRKSAPLPSTKPTTNRDSQDDGDDYEDSGSSRPLSKAERRRMRRAQQQDRAA